MLECIMRHMLPLIVIHFCIIFHIHIMHYVNKNKLFTLFLSKFAGPPLMERKAHNLWNYQGLMGLIKSQKKSPKVKPRSGVVHAYSQPSRRSNVANRLQQNGNRICWRNGQDSAAETRLWPRIRGRNLAVEPAI